MEIEMEIDLVDDDSVILVTGEEHRLKGNEYYKKLNYEEALECYTAAINTEPNVALFYSNRSAANLMLLRYKDALNDAKKACYLDDTNIKALIRLCKCYIIIGAWEAAKSEIDKALRLDCSNKDIKDQIIDIEKYKDYYAQYQSQYDKGDFRHALYCIDNCLKISHSSTELKLIRVDLYIHLKRYTEAKDILEKQLIDDKQGDNQMNTEALFYRGLCFYYLEHLDKAQTHFQHVLKLYPDHKKAQLAYKRCKKLIQLKDEGNTLVRTCQYNSARIFYSNALLVDKDHDTLNAKLHFNRALTLHKLGQYQNALEDCDTALSLDPTYQKVKTRRLQCLIGLELWMEAVREAGKLHKLHPSEEHAKLLKEAQLGLKRSKQVDLYKVLGVPKNASDADLKKGYRKRALVHHPDRHSNADEATKKGEEQKFKEVNTAYSVLSDPRKRQMYDGGADVDVVLGNGGGGGFHGDDHYEVFHSFFNNGGHCGSEKKFNHHFQ